MAKKENVRLSKLELEMMDVLWQLGSSSVRELQEHLPEQRRPAYTTVHTIITRLEEKGAVRRAKKVSNAYIFEPTISRQAVQRRLINELLDLLGGKAWTLISHLIESKKIGLADISAMEKAIAEAAQQEAAVGEVRENEVKSDAGRNDKNRRKD